jgi:hypothetical protein
MIAPQIIVGAVAEIAGFFIVYRIWKRRRHRNIAARIFWSFVLLVPLFGIMIYFFINESPEEHPYESDNSRSDAETLGGDAGPHC